MRRARMWAGLAVAAFLAAGWAPDARAMKETVNGVKWNYGVVDGGAMIMGSLWAPAIPASTSGAIKIPSKLGGHPVRAIDSSAFMDCNRLTRVTIPDSVRRIDDAAFADCTGLKAVTIGNGTTNVGFHAFLGCRNLRSVVVGNRVKTVGYQAFSGCNKLTTLYVPASWKGTSKLKNAGVPSGCGFVYTRLVKFNAHGGTVSPETATVPDNQAIGKLPTPTRKGHKFMGWHTAAKGGSKVTRSYTVTANRTFHAHWLPYLTITFDANGGKVKPAKRSVLCNRAVGKLPTPARKGHKFTGWHTAAKGGSKVTRSYKAKASRTLYAHWRARPYKVAFAANGGTGTMKAQTMVYGKAAKLSRNAFRKRGNLFLGWATSKNGKVALADGAAVKNLRADGKTVTLYAVWEKGEAVLFDANGGTCPTQERAYRTGGTYGSFPVPEWAWHSFLGWFTAANGGKWVSEMDIAETKGVRKLFAHWEPMPLRLGAAGRTVGPDGAGNLVVEVSAKAAWTASTEAGWIVLRTKSGQTGTGRIVFDVASNDGDARTGRIIVSAGGKALVFSVGQQARTLRLSASSKRFSATAAPGQTLEVEATVPWTAQSSAPWLAVETSQGDGNGTIAYDVAANAGAGRAAAITVAGGGKTASFRVEQTGKDGSDPDLVRPAIPLHLSIEPDEQTYGAEGATNELAFVTADMAWTAGTTNRWIELLTKGGTESGLLAYRVGANTGNARTGTVTVAGGGLLAVLTIGQKGKGDEAPYLEVSPAKRTAAASAASGEAIWVEANVAWRAWTSADWITLGTEAGRGSGPIAYSISANGGTGRRTGSVMVRGGGLEGAFTLTQEGKAASPQPAAGRLRVVPGSRMHGNGPADGAFLVEANVGWTAVANQNWIVVHTPSGQNNGSVSYSLAGNPGGERSGTITVGGGGLAATFTVGQGGKTVRPPASRPKYRFEVVPHKLHLDWQARKAQCTVVSDVSWEAYSHESHIHVETAKGIPGSKAIPFRVDENPSARYKQIGRVYACGEDFPLTLYDSCMVVQSPKEKYFEIRPHSVTIPWKGATDVQCQVYTFSGNETWNVQGVAYEKGGGGWITVTGHGYRSGSKGDGYVTFDVAENPDGGERRAKIIVWDGETTSTCVVTQERGVVLTVTPSPPPIQPAQAGYGPDLVVEANADWSASVTKGADWIRLTRNSGGASGGIIRFELKENKLPEAREGSITVVCDGKEVVVSIRQAQSVLPNLAFFKPDRWPAAVFVTTDKDSRVRRESFTAGSTPIPCIRFAWKNTGIGGAGPYTIKGVVTCGTSTDWTTSRKWMSPNQGDTNHFYHGILNSVGSVVSAPTLPGTYTVVITLDSEDDVKETCESDNVQRVSFRVLAKRSTRGSPAEHGGGETSPAGESGGDAPGESGGDEDWLAVTASDGTDAGAVADGDEGTAWGTDGADGAWVILTFPWPRDVEDVEVVGDRLPEGIRVFLSEDAESWQEGVPGRAQYVWVAFPAGDGPLDVKEIRVAPE